MIKVKTIGSIEKILGNNLFTFDKDSIPLQDVIKILYKLDMEKNDFSSILSDIIIAINGIALSNGFDDLILESGDEVTLIPISHGG